MGGGYESIQILTIMLSGMKPKYCQPAYQPSSSLHLPHQFDPPVLVTTIGTTTGKKCLRSTQLTQRSSSRKKVLIPHSPKLTNFFSSRPLSTHKSFSTTSTDDQTTKLPPPLLKQERLKAADVLRQNLNNDYFDEITAQNLKDRLPPRETLSKNGLPLPRVQFLRDQPTRYQDPHLGAHSSYRSETLIRPVEIPKLKEAPCKRPQKVFVKPIKQFTNLKQKLKSTKRQQKQGEDIAKKKMQTSLQYTFGLNY